MPNECSNTITIKGPTETVKNLWENATAEDGGLLSAMVPQPENIFLGDAGEEERKECETKGIPHWYDWNYSNWGTKWDVSTEALEFTDHGDGTASIEGWFISAWGPPLEAYKNFCEGMDAVFLKAFYEESNMCFVGCWDSEGSDDWYDYEDLTSDTIRDTVPAYLVDHYELDQRLAEEEEEAEYNSAEA